MTVQSQKILSGLREKYQLWGPGRRSEACGWGGMAVSVIMQRHNGLALQLRFSESSESMGNHDSERDEWHGLC